MFNDRRLKEPHLHLHTFLGDKHVALINYFVGLIKDESVILILNFVFQVKKK